MQHSTRRDLPEKFIRYISSVFIVVVLDNTPLIERILQPRQEKSPFTGSNSWRRIAQQNGSQR